MLTVLHAGGKFGDGGGYKVSGGLHGVGVSVVNALSELLLDRDPPRRPRLAPGATSAARRRTTLAAGRAATETGTTITFLPDAEIFETTDLDFSVLEQRLRETAFLTRGLKISLTDERGEGAQAEFQYEGGIEDFVALPQRQQGVDRPQGRLLRGRERRGRGRGRDAVEHDLPGVGLLLRQQHQHARGRLAPVGLPLGADAHAQPLRAREGPAQGEGREPHRRGRARGPHRGHLRQARRPAVRGPDEDQARQPGHGGLRRARSSTRSLAEFLEENPQEGNAIIRKAVSAAQARAAARKARDLTRRKSALENSTLPGKLADCSVKDPSLAEIFIVEGDSAGGSAKQGRDRNTQAVLPLRGKILNVEKSRIDKVLKNLEIQALITAIGTGVRDEFDIEKARYHKIILMTDADVDGAHIRTLALTLLFREMPELIEAGYVYIAKPPLYKLKQGSSERYIEKDSELEEILLSDKLEKILVFDRHGTQFKLTEAALAALLAPAQAVRGLVVDAARRVRPRHRRLPRGVGRSSTSSVDTIDAALELIERDGIEDAPYETTLLSRDEEALVVRAVETKTGLARALRIPLRLFDAQDYRNFTRVHGQLIELAGRAPFTVKLGDATRTPRRSRRCATRCSPSSQKGITLQRFKGLGRDERRAAARHDDGPRDAHARAGVDRGRRRRPTSSSRRSWATWSSRAGSSSRTTPASSPTSTSRSDHLSGIRSTRSPEATSSRARSKTRCARRTSTTRCPSSSGARCPTCATA